MVFNGCQPLVQRCDGNDTSLQSNWDKFFLWKKKLKMSQVKRVLDVMPRQNASAGALFVDPFCSLSPSGWMEGPASSKVTHQGTKEPGDVVPWTLFALPTQSALTSTDLERIVTVMLWSPVKIIQWFIRMEVGTVAPPWSAQTSGTFSKLARTQS